MDDLTRPLVMIGILFVAILLPWFIYAAAARRRSSYYANRLDKLDIKAIRNTLTAHDDQREELVKRVAALRQAEQNAAPEERKEAHG